MSYNRSHERTDTRYLSPIPFCQLSPIAEYPAVGRYPSVSREGPGLRRHPSRETVAAAVWDLPVRICLCLSSHLSNKLTGAHVLGDIQLGSAATADQFSV